MARTGKKKRVDFDTDFDFDSGLDEDFFAFDAEPPKDNRRPEQKLKDGIFEGFRSGVANADYAERFAKDVFPKGFGETVDYAREITSRSQDIFDSLQKELKPAIKDFKRVATKLVPADLKLPKLIRSTLDEWQEDIERDKRNSSFSKAGAGDLQDAAISSQLDALFGAQRAEAESDRKTAEQRYIADKAIETKRYQTSLDIGGRTAGGIDRIVQYQNTIDLGYKKKNLELQMRQLFAQQDMLKALNAQLQIISETLPKITKNTALPEFVKQNNREFLAEYNRRKMAETVGNSLFGGGRKYIETMLKNMTAKAGASLKEGASMFMEGLGGAEQFADMGKDMGMDPTQMVGEIVGSNISQSLMGRLGKFLNKNLVGKNERMKAASFRASNMIANAPAMVNRWRERNLYNYDDGVLNAFSRFIAGVMPGTGTDQAVDKRGLNDVFSPGTFTQRTERSITEVIPGYLARILREQTITRTGDEKTPLVVYDWASDKFSTRGAVMESIKRSVVTDEAKERLHNHLARTVDSIGGYDLSPQARYMLMSHMAQSASRIGGADEYQLANPNKYQVDSEGERAHAEEAAAFMEKFFKGASHEQRYNLTKSMNQSNDMVSNPIALIEALSKSGYNEYLKEAGFLSSDGSTVSSNVLLKKYLDAERLSGKEWHGPIMPADVRAQREKAGSMAWRVMSRMPWASDPADDNSIASVMRDGTQEMGDKIVDVFASGFERLLNILENPAAAAKKGKTWVTDQYSKLKGEAARVRQQSAGQNIAEAGNALSGLAQSAVATGSQLTNQLRQSGFIAKLMGSTEGQKVLNRLHQLQQQPAAQWVTKTSKAAWKRKVQQLEKAMQDNPQIQEKLSWAKGEWKDLKKTVMQAVQAGHLDPAKIDAYLSQLDENTRARVTLIIDSIQSFGTAREVAVPEAGSAPNSGEPSANPDQSPGDTPEGEPKPFAKGGLFDTDFLSRPKEFFLKMKNGRTQRAVAGEAGEEAVLPVGDGGVQMISPDGERLGLLPLSRDADGRLSVLSTIFDFAGRAKDRIKSGAASAQAQIQERLNAHRASGGGVGGDDESKGLLAQMLARLISIDEQLLDGLILQSDDGSGESGHRRTRSKRGSAEPSLLRQAMNVGGALGSVAMKPLKWAGVGFSKSMDITSSIFSGAGTLTRQFLGRCKDVYVEGEKIPRLRKVDIVMGRYFNDKGGVIRHHTSINGVVKDADGNIIITAEEAKCLYTLGLGGKMVKLAIKGVVGVKDAAQFVFNKVSMPLFNAQLRAIDAAKDMIGGGLKTLYKALDRPVDIYVVGKREPSLLASVMKRGGYRLRDGNHETVDAPSKITGAVLDEDNNVALTLEDLRKGITDVYGRPIRTPGVRFIANTFGALGAGARAVGRFQKRAWEATKSIGKTLFSAAGSIVRGIGRGIGGVLGMDMRSLDPVAVSAESYNVLVDIRSILDARLPGGRVAGDADGDGDKDGTLSDLRDKAARRHKEEQDKKGQGDNAPKDKKKKDEGSGLLSGLMDFFKGLMGGGGMLGKAGKLLGFGTAAAGASSAVAGATAAAGGTAAATAAGTAAAAGGTTLMGGLMAGLAGIGATALGVLTSPVTLGIAAAALVGYGAYKGYKYLKNSPGPLDQVRMAQYGFDPKDHSHFGRMREFESMLTPVTKMGTDGVSIDITKIDMKRAASIFDVDMDDKKQSERFLGWYNQRFKPVYATHVAVMSKLANGSLDLETSKIKKKDWGAALQAMRFEEGPYDYSALPNADYGKCIPRYQVTATYRRVKEEYNINDQKSQSGLVTEEKPKAESTVKPKDIQDQLDQLSKPESSFSRGVGITGDADQATKDLLSSSQKKVDELSDELSVQINNLPDIAGLGNKVSAVDTARFKAYGLTTMDPAKVAVLRQLEAKLSENFTGNTWSGKMPELLNFAKGLFGVSSLVNPEGQALSQWLTQRAMKVYTIFWAAASKYMKGFNKNADAALLDPNEQIIMIQLLKGLDVWQVTVSPWTDYMLNILAKSVDENINFIQSFIKQKALVEEKKAAVAAAKTQVARVQESMPQPTAVSASPSSPAYSPPSIPTRSVMGPSSGLSSGNNPSETATADPTKLNELKSTAPGDIKKIVTDAANIVGVDPALALSTVAIESNFKPDAKPPVGSARGLYQFIDSTWKAMLSKYGIRYGLDPYNTSPLDPMANSLMGAHFIKDNVNYLTKVTGDSNITPTDTYAAHFLGPAGAAQLLKAVNTDPGASAPALMPGPAKANNAIFYNGQQPRSVSEVYKVLDRKVVSAGKKYGLDVKADTDPVVKVADTGSSTAGTPGVSTAPVARSRVPSSADISSAYSGASNAGAPAGAGVPMARNALSRESLGLTARNNQTISSDAFGTTNNILSNQLKILTEIRDILKGNAGATSEPAAPAAEEIKPNQVTQSGTANYAMPKLPVSMRRAV